MGDTGLVDTCVHDGLTDVFNNYHMGITGRLATKGPFKYYVIIFYGNSTPTHHVMLIINNVKPYLFVTLFGEI